jgi:tetratricopeptide (TPR) repeat protein
MKSESQSGPVVARVEQLVLPTYPVLAADTNPLFFEKRNIQGSAGYIYPNPFHDRLSSASEERTWEVILLENEYIQLLMMPALGGRIFAGLDKTNGYDFFYRQRVIKPALIGLFGPWISGGLEFNWPQHHRPSTFMPVEYRIEAGEDGSRTVWLSENEPMNRMKGMVGICLYPGKSLVDLKVQLYNRTPHSQTFLWWNNAAVHIHEDYQVFFPPDVHYAIYHGKQFVVEYPLAKGSYAGVDLGAGTDVSWYKNIPYPTSFFAAESNYEFFGGYDHRRDAGVVHVADRHISPGKKFFTWGNGPFGHHWQRQLADDDDPYLELMAGVYTDNQPDFSWLQPFETKYFHQYWFPIQGIGPAKNANRQAAINLEVEGSRAKLGVLAVENIPGARVRLSTGERVWFERELDLAPGKPSVFEITLPERIEPAKLLVRVNAIDGSEIIRYAPEGAWDGKLPEPFQPAPGPKDTKTIDELYLAGLHLEQYRHPVLDPETYWEEALRRDPNDLRCNNALGRRYLRRGDFLKAEACFRRAIQRGTWRNYNPLDGEPYYNLGLALRYLGRDDEAYEAFYRSIWSYAWQSAGYFAIAELDCQRQDFVKALENVTRALQTNEYHIKARNLKTALLRRLGRQEQAETFARETIQLDCLDFGSHNELVLALRQQDKTKIAEEEFRELVRVLRHDPQNYIDLAFDYANAGLYAEAGDILGHLTAAGGSIHPMVLYSLGFFAHQLGDEAKSLAYAHQASRQPPGNCFPSRLEELLVLRQILRTDPQDARANYYLANLLYDKRHAEEAIDLWKKAAALEPDFAIPWRNLGLAAYNMHADLPTALDYYQRAFQADPRDARTLSELDQIRRRLGVKPEERLAELEKHLPVVDLRDDLTLEMVGLFNRTGQPEKAKGTLQKRHFHPWEGGEGLVTVNWTATHMLLGRRELEAGRLQRALEYFMEAMTLPHLQGEAGYAQAHSFGCYFSGLAEEAGGDTQSARKFFQQAVDLTNEGMVSSEYYRALALRKLGDDTAARRVLKDILAKASQRMDQPVQPDYFYTINPSALFADDVIHLNRLVCTFLAGLAYLGLGSPEQAKAAFSRVLEMDPGHLEAWEEFRRL